MFFEDEKNRKQDEELPTSLITRLLEAAVVIVISCYLIKLGMCYLLQVWPVILVVAIILLLIGIAWRVWKHRHDIHW